MSLVICPDCAAEISEAAYVCPWCARPMRALDSQPTRGAALVGCVAQLVGPLAISIGAALVLAGVRAARPSGLVLGLAAIALGLAALLAARTAASERAALLHALADGHAADEALADPSGARAPTWGGFAVLGLVLLVAGTLWLGTRVWTVATPAPSGPEVVAASARRVVYVADPATAPPGAPPPMEARTPVTPAAAPPARVASATGRAEPAARAEPVDDTPPEEPLPPPRLVFGAAPGSAASSEPDVDPTLPVGPAQRTTLDPAVPPVPDLAVTSWSWQRTTGDRVRAEGAVLNRGRGPAESVRVVVAFLDDRGRVLEAGETTLDPQRLEPGRSGRFVVLRPWAPEMRTARLEVDRRAGTPLRAEVEEPAVPGGRSE